MSFQPFVLGTGLVAWRNLQRTLPAQLDAFSQTSQQKRLVAHFEEKAPSFKSGQDLVVDRQALTVALGAYGLQDDLGNRFFVQKMLDEGTVDPDSLANRMADSRYRRFSSDLAMDGISRLVGILPSTAADISQQYQRQAFSAAVGAIDPNLRLALNADDELGRLAEMDVSEDAKWYLVMGNPPLRAVMETALGLPSSFGRLDLDQQLDVFKDKAQATFGTGAISAFSEENLRSEVIDRFLLRDQMKQGSSLSGQNIALQLLSI